MNVEIGVYLRKLRLERGEKLKDMAENLNVSSSFLSAVENGKKNFPESWYEKLETLYNLSHKQKEDLKLAVIKSREIIELNIENISPSNRDLAICFARHFSSLDEKTSKQIFDILKESEKEE